MRTFRPLAVVLCFGMLLGVAPGCAKKDGDTGDATENNLRGIHEMYETYMRRARKPPAKMDDLTRMGTAFPNLVAAIRQGEIVYVWGAGGHDDPADTIIAYSKGAPDQGGLAIQKDGTVVDVKPGQIKAGGK
jgi:hypothetical protein